MTITLQTKSGEFKFECQDGEPVLFAGLRAGIDLPYECATGTCGTCRARTMSGACTNTWTDAPGMARYHADKGDVLMCQARTDGDCLLRVPAEVTTVSDTLQRPTVMAGRITEARMLTSDVLHIELALDQATRFEAGQFMVVSAPGLEGGRAYSMVNFARETHDVTFVIKRKPDGGFSDWAFENAIVGSTVSLFGPLGKAVFRPEENCDLLCITGGSGIAGIMSILSHASDTDYFADHDGQLYFGVRTLSDGFYLSELNTLVERSSGRLQVTLALSDEEPADSVHPEFSSIRLAGGFVHDVAAAALQEAGTSYDNAIGFVAGPPPMVDGAIRVLLTGAGLTPDRIRYDKFS